MKDVLRVFGCFAVFSLRFVDSNTLGLTLGGICTTPDRQPGECVKLNLCQSLSDLVRKTPLRHSDRVFLRESQCQYTDYPWVCCPADEVQVTTIKSKTINKNAYNSTRDAKPALLKPSQSICGRPVGSIDNRIYGGSQTTIGEFPWMALLVYDKPNGRQSFGCGGSLITSKHVLTAAHCVIKELIPVTWTLLNVRLGEWDKSTNPDCQDVNDVYQCAFDSIDVPIESLHPHELYNFTNPNKVNDIAVITLESAVAFTEYVRPICLPIDGRRHNTNFGSLTVVGFGKTEIENHSDRMMKAEIDIYNLDNCKRKYRVQGRLIQNSQLCAIRDNSDACNGDSGSPLMKLSDTHPPYWLLLGVTSYGPSFCGKTNNNEYPGIYTNVIHFIDWIKAKIKI